MKDFFAIALLLAVSTGVLADQDRWRSPFTPAPSQATLSKLDEEKQAPVQQREMAGRHHSQPRAAAGRR